MNFLKAHFCIILFSLFVLPSTFAQAEFIKVECNKTLSLFTFMEAAAQGRATSISYTDFILEHLGGDEKFMALVDEFSMLEFEYQMDWEEYPKMRHGGISAKDLLWMSLSQSENIEDFNQRFYGAIPMHLHSKLIRLLKEGQPYFEKLVWDPQQANIQRMVDQLSVYKPQIKDLFLKTCTFYGVEWDQNIPFTVQLYPVPLERGMTTAIPKGNALICAFLSENEKEHLGVLGIAIHEMCHIIYSQQSVKMQHEIDSIYNAHPSAFAQKAYNYLDEGLATALGNGWAYREVHGVLDTSQWYNHEYINNFARAMFADVVEYVDAGKTMDASFLHQSIATFEKTFPNANREVLGLLNQVMLFVNAKEQEKLMTIPDMFIEGFNARGIWMASPMDDPEGKDMFEAKAVSKFFIIEENKTEAYALMQEKYPQFTKPPVKARAFLYTFNDSATGSMIFLVDVQSVDQLENLLNQLSGLEFIDPGTLLVYSPSGK